MQKQKAPQMRRFSHEAWVKVCKVWGHGSKFGVTCKVWGQVFHCALLLWVSVVAKLGLSIFQKEFEDVEAIEVRVCWCVVSCHF